MTKKYTTEEQKLIDKSIEEIKNLVKTYGFEYMYVASTKYFNTMKAKKKLLGEIKSREKELEELKTQLAV